MPDRYENRVALFIDILDFQGIINRTIDEKNDNPEKIQKLYDTLELIRHVLNVGIFNTEQTTRRITQFSDSIVISFKADQNGEIFNLLADIHFLTKLLVKNDVLCRGGIAYGKLIHDDKFVFGPALIDAYHAESKAAHYPRIILDKTILQLAAKFHNNEYNSPEWELGSIFTMLNKDTDEMFYIDYIEKGEWGNLIIDYSKQQYVDKLRQIIQQGVKSPRPDIKVKYGWMQDKYNKLVDQWKKRYLQNDEFDIGEPEMIEYARQLQKI
jgi:hypothetical protein